MSRFDESAEGAAAGRRRGDGDNQIPPAEVRALKKALGAQHRKLEEDLSSVDVLLHTDPSNPNSPVEQGPAQPGTPSFEQGVNFIGRVADDIRAVQGAVSRVKIDKDDKKDLLYGLNRLAKAWDERAHAFETPDPVSAAAKYRTVHELEKEAAPARRVLNLYFPDAAEAAGEAES
jgi:hypothetical protein